MTYPKNEAEPDDGDGINDATAKELRQFIEQIEFIEGEIKDLNADKSDKYGELKGRGYDVKAVKRIIARRRRDAEAVREEDAIYQTYLDALEAIGAKT